MVQKSNPALNFFKSIYYNDFQWFALINFLKFKKTNLICFSNVYFPRAVVKSFGLFFMGVRIAKEFVGVEIMPAIHH